MLVGALVLAGWIFEAEILKGLYGGITMKSNAAVAFLLCGAALWLVHHDTGSWPWQFGRGCAAAAGLIGAATLSQHLFGWDLGIDQFLFTEEPGSPATTSPGRMGPPASTCFALAGGALLLRYHRRASRVAQGAAILIVLAALLGVTGYAYGAQTLYGVARYTGIALHTALTLLALGVGIGATTVDRGIGAIMVGAGVGSITARRLLLFAVAVPMLLGWLRLRLEATGYLEPRFGVAALVLAIIVILATLIVRTAAHLDRLEEQRLAAEDQLRHLLGQTQEARTLAEAANRAKDDFLATVSHELRTPLVSILGWAAMLRDGIVTDPAAAKSAAETIERNSKAQLQLIDDLLDTARIAAGKLQLDVNPLELTSVVTVAADVVRHAAAAKDITLRLVTADAPVAVRGDATRLQQVVWNLLANAVKFTPRGGTIDVRVSVADGQALVVVSDTGDGIHPDFLPHVFNRFTQAESATTRRHGGLGLGLSIARHLVELHGGTIEACSDGPGKGARFVVRLPVAHHVAAAPDLAISPTHSVPHTR